MPNPTLNCPCLGTVPIVSRRLALQVLGQVPRWDAERILKAAVGWLIEQHPGLELYRGIQGRQHTDEERVAVGRELATVARLPCPFQEGRTCILGGLGPGYNRASEGNGQPYAWLPMHVAKALAPENAKKMVRAGAVADAKAVYLNTNEVGLIALHSR